MVHWDRPSTVLVQLTGLGCNNMAKYFTYDDPKTGEGGTGFSLITQNTVY